MTSSDTKPASTTPIASMPTEIGQKIAEPLSTHDQAMLVRTSKQMRETWEPVLWDQQNAKARAVQWACQHGSIVLLERAVSFGAPLGFLTPQDSPEIPTILIAIKHGQMRVFDYLVARGATVMTKTNDPRMLRQHMRNLLRLLCSAGNIEYLRRLQSTNLWSLQLHIPCIFIALGQLPVTRVIEQRGSIEHLQLCIDSGADVNEITKKNGHCFITPLTACVLAELPEHYDCLIANGAGVPDPTSIVQVPLHIPIFAAAVNMARPGQSAAMQRFTDFLLTRHEGDICESTLIHYRGWNWRDSLSTTWEDHWSPQWKLMFTTPLLTYLASVDFNTRARQQLDGNEDVKAAVDYFLSRGASLGSSSRPLAHSAVSMLLKKYTIQHLEHQGFHHLIAYLISLGGAEGLEPRDLLDVKSYQSYVREGPSGSGLEWWFQDLSLDGGLNRAHLRRLLPLHYLLNSLATNRTHVKNPTEMLVIYVLQASWIDARLDILEDVFATNVQYLIDIGANINAVDPMPGVTTILHTLADWWIMKAVAERETLNSHPSWHIRVWSNRVAMCELLLSKGCNPYLAVDGWSPMRIMFRGTGGFQVTPLRRIDHYLMELMAEHGRNMGEETEHGLTD